jgi:hypothetical protein
MVDINVLRYQDQYGLRFSSHFDLSKVLGSAQAWLIHLEKDKVMSNSQSIPNISDATLRDAIKKEYENVGVNFNGHG